MSNSLNPIETLALYLLGGLLFFFSICATSDALGEDLPGEVVYHMMVDRLISGGADLSVSTGRYDAVELRALAYAIVDLSEGDEELVDLLTVANQESWFDIHAIGAGGECGAFQQYTCFIVPEEWREGYSHEELCERLGHPYMATEHAIAKIRRDKGRSGWWVRRYNPNPDYWVRHRNFRNYWVRRVELARRDMDKEEETIASNNTEIP